jgi:hypothetical protein
VRNDGTTALIPGEVPAPVNTHSSIPVHHSHQSYHTHLTHSVHRHRHHTPPLRNRPALGSIGPIKILKFDPKKVARFLHGIAVLKARRDKLVIVWETYDEIRDVNKKTIPQHSNLPGVRNIFRGTTTVETGDIQEVLRIADGLAEGWAKEFTAASARSADEARSYALKKISEGQEHLKAMSRIYSQAAQAGVAERNQADGLERLTKTVKLGMDLTVSVVGALLDHGEAGAGFGIEMGYVLLSSEDFWNAAWGVKEPELVGFEKGTGKEAANTLAKEGLHKLAEIVEHAIGKTAKEMLLKNEKTFVESLETLEMVVNAEAKWFAKAIIDKGVPASYIGHMVEGGELLAARKAQYAAMLKLATKSGRKWVGALKGARWVLIAEEFREKYSEYRETWEKPMEGEERQEEGGKGEKSGE